MPLLVFHNGTVILPDRTLVNGAVLCRDGRIAAIGHDSDLAIPPDAVRVDAAGGHIGPGYVDIHTHGGAGADFMDATPEAVRTGLRAHARHGTTTIFPTTTTGRPEQLNAMLAACLEVQQSWTIADGAWLGGVHLYGPYFAENMIGAHPPGRSRPPAAGEYLPLFELDIIKVATCAAELPGAEDFYREAARRGCLATCGHSNASWTEMKRGLAAGMRHVDHFWCAMSSVPSLRERFKIQEQPMHGSMEQFVLRHEEMSTEVIADGCHLSAELLEFAFFMKGPRRFCLVTDASRALDMPPGEYMIGPLTDGAPFLSNGRVGYKTPGFRLASTVVGMEVMVRNMHAMSGAGLADTVRMASLTPAERVGMLDEIGSLEIGKRADVLVLNETMHVQRVFINGSEFEAKNPESYVPTPKT